MTWLGYLWTAAAWWFVASVLAAPAFLLVRKARARGRRLFRDLPMERIDKLAQPPVYDHSQDAL